MEKNPADRLLSSEKRTPSGRKSPAGITTTSLVVSAYVANNADVFPKVLRLHVQEGSKIADVTYGKGVFWRKIRTDKYDFYPSDIADGTDCRSLPYEDESFDCIVLILHTWKGSSEMAIPLKLAQGRTMRFVTTIQTDTKRRNTEVGNGTQQW